MKKILTFIAILIELNLNAQTVSVKISDLPEHLGNPNNAYIPLVAGGVTKKYNLSNFVYVGSSYNNPSWLTGLHANKILQSGASIGQSLIWNGTTWSPGLISGADSLTFATWKRLYKVRDSLLAAGNTFTGINTFQTDYVYFKGKTDLTIIDGTDTVRIGKGTYGIYNKAFVVGTDQSNPIIFATNKIYRGKFSDSGLHVYSPYIYLNNGADTAATKADLRSIGGGSGTGGLSGGNLGAGWRLYYPPSQGVKTLRSLYGIIYDSTTLSNSIAISVDTANVETKASSLNYYNILSAANSTQDLAISNHTTLIASKVNQADSFYSSSNYLTRGTWSKDSSLLRALILLNTDSIAAHNTRIIANTNSINTKLNASDSVNYQLRYPDANVQSSSYTIVLSDAGKIVEINNGSSVTLTIPPNGSVAFPIGTIITVVQRGAGQITFTPGSGVTINSNNSWLRSGGQFSYMGIRKISSNTWDLYGNINP